MEVIAHARHIRMSPRKVRLVVDLVRGMDVDRAAAQLKFYRKAAARPVLKLLMSAVANAEHNFKLGTENLYIKAATVDQGPTLKRWRPRAFGRAAGIKKRSSHITIILDERKIAGTPESGVSAAVVKKSDADEAKVEASAKKAPATKAAPKAKSAKSKTVKA